MNLFPLSAILGRSRPSQATFKPATPGTLQARRNAIFPDCPELGDWEALQQRYNALPEEPLPARAYVWGAGAFGREMVARLTRTGTQILGMIDRNSQHWSNGDAQLACISPEALMSRERAPVIIGIHNYGVDYAPLMDVLQTNGFDAWTPQRLWRAAGHAGLQWPAAFWLDFPFWGRAVEGESALEKARDAFELMADETSAQVFWRELCARALAEPRFRVAPEQGQYAPASLPRWSEPVRLVDAGAFNGDTLRFFSNSGLQLGQCLCFEPDPGNFEALLSARLSGVDVMCWPLGLSDRVRTLRFSTGMGGASHLSEDGETIIQCVGLDQAAPDFPATLLKMDVEGAEIDALNGAQTLIERSGCAMAISAYHTPDHLWEVPLRMHQLAPDHLVCMRSHAFNGFDTVAYALPPQTRALLQPQG